MGVGGGGGGGGKKFDKKPVYLWHARAAALFITILAVRGKPRKSLASL